MADRIIAKEGLLNDAQWLMDTIKTLVDQAIAASDAIGQEGLTAAEVNIAISPCSDRSDGPNVTDNAFLIEETLSDGSKVYNIEIF